MKKTAVTIVKHLANGPSDVKSLMKVANVREWQINSQIKELVGSGYVAVNGDTVVLMDGPKPSVLRMLAKKIDIEKVMKGSNETVFSHLSEPKSIDGLALDTGLSQATVYRTVSDLESAGAITRTGNTIRVKPDKHLVFLAGCLSVERNALHDPNAETLYEDSSKTLRKVQKNKYAEGELTGFSMFTEYGIEYRTNHDYYVMQDDPLDLQAILIHAVFDAQKNRDRHGMIMAIIFYLKHKDKMDILDLRRTAASFGIADVWIDVEGYVRNNESRDSGLFLPRPEFVEKADLYDVPPDMHAPPAGYPKLFEALGKSLQKKTRAFIIGGENMRIKGLKPSTKDVDIVVGDTESYHSVVDALERLGYAPSHGVDFSTEDLRIRPSMILNRPNRSRIDLFTGEIMRDLSLSSGMIRRARTEDFDNLALGILCNEDVFLLKSVACREGDIQDMAALVAGRPDSSGHNGTFDWETVWSEILDQEKRSVKFFTDTILDQISYLAEQTELTVPILAKLRNRVTDAHVQRLLRGGSMHIMEIVDLLIGGDITESTIRNRIDALAKSQNVEKRTEGKTTRIRLLKNRHPDPESKINGRTLGLYIDWRFSRRTKLSDRHIKELAIDLVDLGFEKIGKLDELVADSVHTLNRYEVKEYPKLCFNTIAAIKLCIGLNYPELGKKRSSGYFVSKFETYHHMVRGQVYF